MRWLDREQDGAVAVIVAIMLVVLMGVGAFVLDVGNLYWERRQLQNAADAGAMSAAQELIAGGSENEALAEARKFAMANNSRGAHVDGGEFLADITPSSVTVVARTGETPEDTLPSILAGVLNVTDYGTSARATVEWSGSVAGGRTIPIAICNRAWEYWTDLNRDPADPEDDGLPTGPPAHMVSYGGAASADHEVCTNPSFDTYSGGFAYLRRDQDCMITTRLDETKSPPHVLAKGVTGNNPQDTGVNGSHPDCDTAEEVYQRLLKPTVDRSLVDPDYRVLIPIFDGYINSTNEFRLIGYGAFRLLGYHSNAGTGSPSSYMLTKSECNAVAGPPNSASCLKGYFTDWVALGDAEIGGPAVPSFGAVVARFVE
jgi:hypothetical protein